MHHTNMQGVKVLGEVQGLLRVEEHGEKGVLYDRMTYRC
eukprot:SAG31_NODE_6186_length_2132_cov_1.652238_1_plen_39_part_00